MFVDSILNSSAFVEHITHHGDKYYKTQVMESNYYESFLVYYFVKCDTITSENIHVKRI